MSVLMCRKKVYTDNNALLFILRACVCDFLYVWYGPPEATLVIAPLVPTLTFLSLPLLLPSLSLQQLGHRRRHLRSRRRDLLCLTCWPQLIRVHEWHLHGYPHGGWGRGVRVGRRSRPELHECGLGEQDEESAVVRGTRRGLATEHSSE